MLLSWFVWLVGFFWGFMLCVKPDWPLFPVFARLPSAAAGIVSSPGSMDFGSLRFGSDLSDLLLSILSPDLQASAYNDRLVAVSTSAAHVVQYYCLALPTHLKTKVSTELSESTLCARRDHVEDLLV